MATKVHANAAFPKWDLKHLHVHLQAAVDLEFWTIPYYMTMMYSIKDPASGAYRLIQSVVYQEMLHAQLMSNIATAYGYSPTFAVPVYEGQNIPHLDFELDEPDPRKIFHPFSAELGPLDEVRVNGACLIEFPEWDTGSEPDLHEDVSEYGSIGEFYIALQVGMSEMRELIRGRKDQVNLFDGYYNHAPSQVITKDGDAGLAQAIDIIDIIIDQGEGKTQGDLKVPAQYENTADGFEESWSHYRKFLAIRDHRRRPEVYHGVADPPKGSAGYTAQMNLAEDFAAFLPVMQKLFATGKTGEGPDSFSVLMPKVGGDILNCWKNQAIPRFSPR